MKSASFCCLCNNPTNFCYLRIKRNVSFGQQTSIANLKVENKRAKCRYCKCFEEFSDPKCFFAYRDGATDIALKQCIDCLVNPEDDGQWVASYVLTEVNLWNIDKERLILLTVRSLLIVKYDFIALKIRNFKRIRLESIVTILIGELTYPVCSLMPQRNTKGVRLICSNKTNSIFDCCFKPPSICTFTYHPVFYLTAGDVSNDIYNLEIFAKNIKRAVRKFEERRKVSKNCFARFLKRDILLPNYIGFGSVIHNKYGFGLYKVRGRISF